jgi:CheY-like chemotaxis protein
MEPNRKDRSALVLVVDDDPFVRAVGADILEDAGFAVLEAGDAEEALKLLTAYPDINVVFTDVEMPGAFDGLALASRASEIRPGIGIVLTSGRCAIEGSAMPRHGLFVSKPYAGTTLLRRIADAMRNLDPNESDAPNESHALSA